MSILHWMLSDPDVVIIYGFDAAGMIAMKDLVKQINFNSEDPDDPDHPVVVPGDDLNHLMDTPYRVALVDFAKLQKQEIRDLVEHFCIVEARFKQSNDEYRLNPIIAVDFVNSEELTIPSCIYPLSSVSERKQIKIMLLDIFNDFETAQILHETSDDTLRIASIYKTLLDGDMVSLSEINRSFDYENIDKARMLKDFDVIRSLEGRDCIQELHTKDRYVYIF